MDVKRDYTPTVYINCINPIIHQLNIMLHIIQLTIEFTKLCASTWRDSVIRGLTVWWWDPWEPSPATAGNWCYTAWCGSNKHDDLVNLKNRETSVVVDRNRHITSYHIISHHITSQCFVWSYSIDMGYVDIFHDISISYFHLNVLLIWSYPVIFPTASPSCTIGIALHDLWQRGRLLPVGLIMDRYRTTHDDTYKKIGKWSPAKIVVNDCYISYKWL